MAKNKSSPPSNTEKPKADPPAAKPGWAVEAVHVCGRIALKLIGTGNAGILLVLGIVLSLIWHLSSTDLKEVLVAILNNHTLAFMGWAFFLIALTVATWIIRSLRTSHDRQTDRLTNLHGEEMRRILDEHRNESDRGLPAKASIARPAHDMLPSEVPDHRQNHPPA